MPAAKNNHKIFWIVLIVVVVGVQVIIPYLPTGGPNAFTGGQAPQVDVTSWMREASDYSFLISLFLVYYLFSTTTAGNLFKAIRTMLLDFHFEFFIIKSLLGT